jgi:phage baseplate assembly protein W
MANGNSLTTLAPSADFTNLPGAVIIAKNSPFYNELMAIWPDLYNQKVIIGPSGNGMDRKTGKLISGWKHVEQSIEVIFETPFHQRVLRRWVGSFIPHMLGESIVARVITRFFWAIATSLDLWEPRYRIKQVFFMGQALSTWAPQSSISAADLIRLGQAMFRQEGVYYPRGHLGDFTPYQRKFFGVVGRGGEFWDITPVQQP